MIGRFPTTAIVDTTVPPANHGILAQNSKQSSQCLVATHASLTTQSLHDV